MSDRAPDSQPTENIRQVLDHEKRQLHQWKHYKEAELRSLERTERCITSSELSVAQWEKRLAIRLDEESKLIVLLGL